MNYQEIINTLRSNLFGIYKSAEQITDITEFQKISDLLRQERNGYYELCFHGMDPSLWGKLLDLVNTFNVTRAGVITILENFRKQNPTSPNILPGFKSLLPGKLRYKTIQDMIGGGIFYNLHNPFEIFQLLEISWSLGKSGPNSVTPVGTLYSIYESNNLIPEVLCKYSVELISSCIQLAGMRQVKLSAVDKAIISIIITELENSLSSMDKLIRIPEKVLQGGFFSKEFENILKTGEQFDLKFKDQDNLYISHFPNYQSLLDTLERAKFNYDRKRK